MQPCGVVDTTKFMVPEKLILRRRDTLRDIHDAGDTGTVGELKAVHYTVADW